MCSDSTSENAAKHLRLHLAEGVGPITFTHMMDYFGSVERILGAPAGALREI